jgi:hypothetical protein
VSSHASGLCAACPALDRARTLATEFVDLLAHGDANALDPWLTAADRTELRAFAAGLRRDRSFDTACCTPPDRCNATVAKHDPITTIHAERISGRC